MYGWFSKGIDGIWASFNSVFYIVYNWLSNGLANITKNWDSMWDIVWNWMHGGFGEITKAFTSFADIIWRAAERTLNWDLNMNGVVGMAQGGQINEPILGIGRSGQMYQFGENGSETVTPNNGSGAGGTSIIINISSMSGSQQDLNNLRQVILDVVQESSARRGRA